MPPVPALAARRLVSVLDLHRAVISRRLGVSAPLVGADRRWRVRFAAHRSLTTASETTAATADINTAIAPPMLQAPMLPEPLPATPMAVRAMTIPRTVTATTSTGDTGA